MLSQAHPLRGCCEAVVSQCQNDLQLSTFGNRGGNQRRLLRCGIADANTRHVAGAPTFTSSGYLIRNLLPCSQTFCSSNRIRRAARIGVRAPDGESTSAGALVVPAGIGHRPDAAEVCGPVSGPVDVIAARPLLGVLPRTTALTA